MTYKKVGWKNYPSTETPISATNLEHMDAGILENSQAIGDKSKISEIGDGTVAGAIAANKAEIDANKAAIEANTQSLTELPISIATDGSPLKGWRLIPLNITITTTSQNMAQNSIDISKSVNSKNGRCVVQVTLANDGSYINQTATSVSYNIVGERLNVYAFNKNNDWNIGLSCTANVLIFCEKL